MQADFTWLGKACFGVFRLWGSSRWLVVLGSCSRGVWHPPPRVGAASWAAENPRGLFSRAAELGGLPWDGGRCCTTGLSLF